MRRTPHGRRQIRRLLEVDQLAQETQSALKEEEERRRRLAEREKQRLENERREREEADSEVIHYLGLFCSVNVTLYLLNEFYVTRAN